MQAFKLLFRAGRMGVTGFFAALFLLLPIYPLNAQRVVDGGEIIGTVPEVRRIAITGPDQQLNGLIQRAFATHGAFRVTDVAEAAFTLEFRPAGSASVNLRILSGRPPQSLLEQEVSGDDLNNAALRAADLAVRRITGQPGYFAGRLAFVSNRSGEREIYTSDLFFQNVRQLTNDRSKALTPNWSPDARQLLYTGYYRSGFPDLMLVDMDTGRRRVFAGYSGSNTGGVFSPDGRRVAMILSSPGNAELYVSGADGRNPRRLTNNRAVEASPTWSPDGSRIALSSDLAGGPQIYQIPANGGNLSRIATQISGYCTEPDWNPRDADKIIFTAATAGTFQLALYSFQGREANFVTRPPGSHTESQWLNDGRHVILTHTSGSTHSLRILDTESGRITPLHSPNFGNAMQAAFVYPPN